MLRKKGKVLQMRYPYQSKALTVAAESKGHLGLLRIGQCQANWSHRKSEDTKKTALPRFSLTLRSQAFCDQLASLIACESIKVGIVKKANLKTAGYISEMRAGLLLLCSFYLFSTSYKTHSPVKSMDSQRSLWTQSLSLVCKCPMT